MALKKLYVFGNEYLEEDSFAKIVAKEIEDVEIVLCTTPDVLLDINEKEVIILDVVKDTTEPRLIEDLNQIKTQNMISLHDFDLGFFLKLMEKLGIKKKIKIIGIPQQGDAIKIAESIKKWL